MLRSTSGTYRDGENAGGFAVAGKGAGVARLGTDPTGNRTCPGACHAFVVLNFDISGGTVEEVCVLGLVLSVVSEDVVLSDPMAAVTAVIIWIAPEGVVADEGIQREEGDVVTVVGFCAVKGFRTIVMAVPVGILGSRVRLVGIDFFPVGQLVPVGILFVGVGTKDVLVEVGKAIFIGVDGSVTENTCDLFYTAHGDGGCGINAKGVPCPSAEIVALRRNGRDLYGATGKVGPGAGDCSKAGRFGSGQEGVEGRVAGSVIENSIDGLVHVRIDLEGRG